MKPKVYLAKSNRSNPDDVSEVRQILSKYDIEFVEFTGGVYSHKHMLECDSLIVLPDLSFQYDTDDFETCIPVGKGLYHQIEACEDCNISITTIIGRDENGELYCSNISDYDIEDDDDYINYGAIEVDENGIDSLENFLIRHFDVKKSTFTSVNSDYKYLLIGR